MQCVINVINKSWHCNVEKKITIKWNQTATTTMKMLFFFVCLFVKKKERIKINKNEQTKKRKKRQNKVTFIYCSLCNNNDECESLSILVDAAAGPFI